jgi:ABC-type transporter Mla MlaB component
MSKSDAGGGFLSKVARFVMHPTTSWSELESPLPGAGTEQDRQALKAAIERKRRNDFVRKREFDMLREALRQRQAQQQAQAPLPAASAFVQTGSSGDEIKEKTIEKIAQIEAQMSQHWWRKRDGNGQDATVQVAIGQAVPVPHSYSGGVTVPGHLGARGALTDWGDDTYNPSDEAHPPAPALPVDMLRDRANMTTLPIDMVSTGGELGGAAPEASVRVAVASGPAVTASALTPTEAGVSPSSDVLAFSPGLEDAAVRFANGDDLQAEAGLRAVIAQEVHSPKASDAWLALLDVFYANGRIDAFEETAADFAAQFGRRAPRWPSATVLTPLAGQAAAPAPAARWTCPLVLDVAAVDTLAAYLNTCGSSKRIDWSDLLSADLDAATALLGVVNHWLTTPVVFVFEGAGVLRRRLMASTPSGRRENDPIWWQLRLALLRLMHRSDEFDLASLDFCVTYGVLPPEWTPPACQFEAADALAAGLPPPAVVEPIKQLVTQLGGLDVLEWPAMAGDTQLHTEPGALGDDAGGASAPGPRAVLQGALRGELVAVLQPLQHALGRVSPTEPLRIDCTELKRIDFPAAGSLLQWLLGVMAQGRGVELIEVSRMVAVFFHVVGIDEAVPVRLRQY